MALLRHRQSCVCDPSDEAANCRQRKDIIAAKIRRETPQGFILCSSSQLQSEKKGGIGRPMLLIHNSGLGTGVPSVKKKAISVWMPEVSEGRVTRTATRRELDRKDGSEEET